jgi:hypothetical protein
MKLTGRHVSSRNYCIESRVKTPVETVLPRLEQWPYPQLSNTTIQDGAARGRRPLSVSKCTARGYETLMTKEDGHCKCL